MLRTVMWSTRANRNYGPPDGIQPESLICGRGKVVRLESLTYLAACNCIDGSQATLQTKRAPGARRYNIIVAQERCLGNYFVVRGGSKRCAAGERRRGSKRCASGASSARVALVASERIAYKSRPLRSRIRTIDALFSRYKVLSQTPRSRSPCLRTTPFAGAADNPVDSGYC